jgi:hypothetical protein
MKLLSEEKALAKLKEIKDELRGDITERFEHRAKSCLACETPGACCLDAHFVNVHISRLESKAIKNVLASLPVDKRHQVHERIETAIEKYRLTADGESFDRTYACPLFEAGSGCLVHAEGKPVPCIIHACYENAADLPPDEIQSVAELRIASLNKRTYGRDPKYLPIPLALRGA